MTFDIYAEVKNANRIAISGHINPDGDCIGSSLALYFYLKKRMPDAEIVVFLEEPEAAFAHIPGADIIASDYNEEACFDAFIALDTTSDRMGKATPYFDAAKKTVNIDHHISNASGCGMVNYVEPEASATSEMVVQMIPKEYMDATIASLLYMGIAHDTGVFKYSNTTAKTLRLVAELLEYEFDFSKLLDETFYEKTFMQNRLLGRIVLDSELYYEDKVIVGQAPQALMDEFGAKKSDFSGVVEQLRVTRGVVCAVFLYQKAPGLFKVSMRSATDDVDVSKVAVAFGGGGHVRAAGVDMKGELSEIKQAILREIEKQLI